MNILSNQMTKTNMEIVILNQKPKRVLKNIKNYLK